ncbi:MRX1 MIOREX complex component 1 [Candida maltosa Xu316]
MLRARQTIWTTLQSQSVSYRCLSSRSSSFKTTNKFQKSTNFKKSTKDAKPSPSSFTRKPIKDKLKDIVEGDTYNKYIKYKKAANTEFTKKSATAYHLSAALRVLRTKYDAIAFRNEENEAIDLQKLKSSDLKYSSPLSKIIFSNLMQVKKLSGRQIDRNLALALLGTDGKQLKDPYYITENVEELLKVDNDTERAMYLCRIGDKECSIVGMNVIMSWMLKRGKVQEGLKLFNQRKSSGIPTNTQTYVLLFDGIAKALPWGECTPELVSRVLSIFRQWREDLAQEEKSVPIEGFNSCLSILLKDFTNSQAKAWDFFDELMEDRDNKLKEIIPDEQTFTTLLLGVQKLTESRRISVKKTRTTKEAVRTVELLDIEAAQIKTFSYIWEKVKGLAMPPTPSDDTEIDTQNISHWNKTKVEIDMPLVSLFASAFCNRASGTGEEFGRGSHYLGNQQALKILKSTSHDVDSILSFVQEVSPDKDIITPTEKVRTDTDQRIKEAFKTFNIEAPPLQLLSVNRIGELRPQTLLLDGDIINDFNPNVHRPNGRTGFTKTPVPLIDFLRPVTGKPKVNYSINKFLLNQVFDSFISLGRLNEFVIAFWYAVIRWGGLRVDLSIFQNKNNNVLETGVLGTKEITPSTIDRQYVSSIIDEMSVKLFIFKIQERGRDSGMTQTKLITELMRLLVSKDFNPNGIHINVEIMYQLWDLMKADLQYYKRYNQRDAKAPREGLLHYDQLEQYTVNFAAFTDSVYQWIRQVQKKKDMPSSFYENLGEILNGIYQVQWWNLKENQKIYIHKLIVKASVRFYRPKIALEKTEYQSNPYVLENSLKYLRARLGEKDGLTYANIRLVGALKKLERMETGDREYTRKDWDAIGNEIYDIIDVTDKEIVKKPEDREKTTKKEGDNVVETSKV